MVKNKIIHDSKVTDEDEISDEMIPPWTNSEKDIDWWQQLVGSGVQSRPRIDLYLNHWLTLRSLKVTRAGSEFREFENYTKAQYKKGVSVHDNGQRS